jgi:hypothetical protein
MSGVTDHDLFERLLLANDDLFQVFDEFFTKRLNIHGCSFSAR